MEIQTPEWVKDAIFYQIFPDRFAKSDQAAARGLKLEAWASDPTTYGFKGGDLRGIVEHLGYLHDLGVNALYLNPIFSSASNHRYHTYDYFAVDPLLGGNAALRDLLDAAHAHGMKVVLDGVFNHASRGFWQFHHVLENGAGSPYADWFHFNPAFLNGKNTWGAYPNPEQQSRMATGASSYDVLGYQAWWNLPALPKFNTGSPAVREFILRVAKTWVEFGIDGWRLDVPNEINDDSFWQEFRRFVKKANPEAYIVGEIWTEAGRWLQGDQFDASMNYMLGGALLGLMAGEKIHPDAYHAGDLGKFLRPLSIQQFAERIDYLLGLYPPAVNQVQLNLLDSHDMPRFLTLVNGDKNALVLSWFFLMTYPGAPCIYYGDEIGLEGGPDPDCRKSFPWQNPQGWDSALFSSLQELISLRKSQPALRRGSYKNLYAAQDVLAFSRSLGAETLIVLLNRSAAERSIEIPGGDLPLPKLIFGYAKITRAGDKLQLSLPGSSGSVLKR